jgi:hypothetical protein
MSVFKTHSAHTFECDLDLTRLLGKLESLGPWSWRTRDSYYWGDYLSAKASDDASRKVKIYERDDGGFQIDVFFEGEGDDAESNWETFYQDILERLLPGVGATDVKDTEPMN